MINKTLVIIIALLCAVCLMPVMAFSGTGSGTQSNPYVITTTAQWAEMGTSDYYSSDESVYYALGNDLNFQLDPSLSIVLPFIRGNFDGKGYALQNFLNTTAGFTNNPGYPGSQAFGMIAVSQGGVGAENREIKNVRLERCVISYSGMKTDPSVYGLLTGWGGYIKNIYADENSELIVDLTPNPLGSIGVYVGGLVGSNQGTLSDVTSLMSITVNNSIELQGAGDGSVYDAVGGLTGIGIPAEYSLFGGTMTYAVQAGSHPKIDIISGNINGSGYGVPNTLYYDSTKLSAVPHMSEEWGVPTTGLTTKFNFPNFYFMEDTGYWYPIDNYMTMGTVQYHYYPIPYYFYQYGIIFDQPIANPMQGLTVPLTVQFTDGSYVTGIRPYNLTSWWWDFGDGTYSHYQNPIKAYLSTGIYNVMLEVAGEHDANAEYNSSLYIYVGLPSPTPIPTPTPTPSPTPIPTVTATPLPTVTIVPIYPSHVWWSKPNSSAHITSSYISETVWYNFDTVVKGTRIPNESFILELWQQNIQTGVWTFVGFPGYNVQANGTSVNNVIPDATGKLFAGTAWSGHGSDSLSQMAKQYKIELVGYNSTSPAYIYGVATITVSQNPLLVSNLGNWAQAVGGDGLRYFLALVIMLLLTCLPYLLLKQFNIYIEIIMFMLAVGISYYAGLLDIWTLVIIPLGVLAVFILMRNQGGTQ